jgi:hypothetical protein
MLKQLLHDLAGITDESHIHKTVSASLASFGEVSNLKIFDLPEHDSRIVLVTMNTPQAATAAINGLGLMSFGERSVVITVPNRHD